MLNELLIAERGAQEAGVEMTQRHPDVKDARRVPTLLVDLDPLGHVVLVYPVSLGVTLWSIRDGNHNSFPFVQPKDPVWLVPEDDERRNHALDRKSATRKDSILALASEPIFNAAGFSDWPGDGLLKRVQERRQQLASLDGTDAAVVAATMDRFTLACDRSKGGDPQRLLTEIAEKLKTGMRESAAVEWIDAAAAILIEGGGGLMFSAAGDWPSVLEARVVHRVSVALRTRQSTDAPNAGAPCGLTGTIGPLVESKFPQPNLPVLGQTYLFSRNKDAPANDRYGRFSADSMPVSQEVVIRLAAVAEALTSDERRGVTWRPIPGEAPKQSDLLLAFVEAAPDAPVASMLTEDDAEDDLAGETPADPTATSDNSVAAFEERSKRVVNSVKGKIDGGLNSRVRLTIIRKVDPANRKVVYAGQPTVATLENAAQNWGAGERNVPAWLTLPVLRKAERKPRPMSPPHVAPLAIISFSKQLYIRGGVERQEISGLPAAEAFGLFLDPPSHPRARGRATRILHLVLSRRLSLVAGTAHAVRRGFDAAKEFDRREVLRTVTLMGVLLHKLSRTNEVYMNDTAFKLGQLLAAADVVHAGYCADVRGGDVPPSLLGNQVFSMAQTSPIKALANLCRRWKPYAGWAERATRAINSKTQRRHDEEMRESKDRDKSQRGWDISKALSTARRVKPLMEELRHVLDDDVTDEFRAELLLGYIAGLPKLAKDNSTDENQDAEVN